MINDLILIGIIMTITGFIILIIGLRRDVLNTWLWALFPLFHGFHEFADYFVETMNASFLIERFELLFAFASSAMLLAATIEYTGIISPPIGKISGISSLITISGLILFLPESTIDSISSVSITIGSLTSEPFRFIYGFVYIWLSIIALMVSAILIYKQQKGGKISYGKNINQIILIASILLAIFSLFEGFDSNNYWFITLRGVSMAIFVIVPIFVVYSSKIGLQRFFIIHSSGNLVFAYNFALKQEDRYEDDAVLSAGFLAAITGYSSNVLKSSDNFSIKSDQLYFKLLKTPDYLFTLQSLVSNSKLNEVFNKIPGELNSILAPIQDFNAIDNTPIREKILEQFQRFL
jgi:hypothetical protein